MKPQCTSMKTWISILILVFAFHCAQSQSQYTVRDSAGIKIFSGLLQKADLLQESSFGWMRQDIAWYKPDAEAVKHLTRLKGKIHLIVFGGTWCEDSQVVLPQLFKLMDAAQFPEKATTLIGVERNKKTLAQLTEALDVTKVPTIIVMLEGKEVGRVEEYGKYGVFDKTLAEILAAIP